MHAMDLYVKDTAAVFTTQQTDSVFILTSYLKGYERQDIKIEINEDGSKITIIGEHLEKMVTRGFHKTFIIPQGVVLDKVKARFDQEESKLTIRFPKSVKGLVTSGIGIQELLEPNHLLKEKEHGNVVEKTEQENDTQEEEEEEAKPRSIICSPIIAGSAALFVSLIVVVFSLIRSKTESNQRKNY